MTSFRFSYAFLLVLSFLWTYLVGSVHGTLTSPISTFFHDLPLKPISRLEIFNSLSHSNMTGFIFSGSLQPSTSKRLSRIIVDYNSPLSRVESWSNSNFPARQLLGFEQPEAPTFVVKISNESSNSKYTLAFSGSTDCNGGYQFLSSSSSVRLTSKAGDFKILFYESKEFYRALDGFLIFHSSSPSLVEERRIFRNPDRRSPQNRSTQILKLGNSLSLSQEGFWIALPIPVPIRLVQTTEIQGKKAPWWGVLEIETNPQNTSKLLGEESTDLKMKKKSFTFRKGIRKFLSDSSGVQLPYMGGFLF